MVTVKVRMVSVLVTALILVSCAERTGALVQQSSGTLSPRVSSTAAVSNVGGGDGLAVNAGITASCSDLIDHGKAVALWVRLEEQAIEKIKDACAGGKCGAVARRTRSCLSTHLNLSLKATFDSCFSFQDRHVIPTRNPVRQPSTSESQNNTPPGTAPNPDDPDNAANWDVDQLQLNGSPSSESPHERGVSGDCGTQEDPGQFYIEAPTVSYCGSANRVGDAASSDSQSSTSGQPALQAPEGSVSTGSEQSSFSQNLTVSAGLSMGFRFSRSVETGRIDYQNPYAYYAASGAQLAVISSFVMAMSGCRQTGQDRAAFLNAVEVAIKAGCLASERAHGVGDQALSALNGGQAQESGQSSCQNAVQTGREFAETVTTTSEAPAR